MPIKPKDNRTSLKSQFKYEIAIPFYLRDEHLNIDQANEWQSYFLESRNKGFGSRSFAWGLFLIKYYWDPDEKKWKERVINKIIGAPQREAMMKRLIELVTGGRDGQHPNFCAFLDIVIADLVKFRNSVYDVENSMLSHNNKPTELMEYKSISGSKPKKASAVQDSAVQDSAVEDLAVQATRTESLIDVDTVLDKTKQTVGGETDEGKSRKEKEKVKKS